MTKITVTTLSVENLGPFGERQTIDLSISPNKPVVLIKALNGSGKTTLLTALQIGLYGHQVFSSLKRTEYEELLQDLKHRSAKSNSVIEIVVNVEIGGFHRELKICREWAHHNNQLHETLSVSENDNIDIELSEGWNEFISSVLPAELVQLFFFDGEKIEALANPDRLPELLKRATEAFLGIGGIDALAKDLKALDRRTALKNQDSSDTFLAARNNFLNWEKQAKDLENHLEALTQERASAQNAADQAESALMRFSEEAKRKGFEAYRQAAEIRSTATQAKINFDDARTGLIDAISDPILPIAWATSLWSEYKQAWERDQRSRHFKLLSKEFKKRDMRILASLEKGFSKAAATALRQAFEADLKNHLLQGHSRTVRMQDADPKDIESQLESTRQRLKRGLDQLHQAQIAMDRAEQRMGQIPAEEQAADILVRMQEYSKTASLTIAHRDYITQKLHEVQSNLAHVNIRLQAAHDRINAEFRDRTMEAKVLEASARAREALILFKNRLLAAKAQWLSRTITGEFQRLLRKRNLISTVQIDPETYRVSIRDKKGQELPMSRLSAGERQLLATAVLSALIKERKGRFPVVVDTPLARLDQQHRSTLVKEFFGTVAHQVVLLSTDQEAEGLAHAALQPFNNREYELKYDDRTGQTNALLIN